MKTWKLTIKPDSHEGRDSFDICQSKSLLAVGWSSAYSEKQASNIDEAKKLVLQRDLDLHNSDKVLLYK